MTLTCACCGDRHGDIDPESMLCFLCQPCPFCGVQGGTCDPYGGPAGNSATCENRRPVAFLRWLIGTLSGQPVDFEPTGWRTAFSGCAG